MLSAARQNDNQHRRHDEAFWQRRGKGGGVRADELLVEGDVEGYAIWRLIMQAVEGLSGTEPGGKVN